jgi:hypothetical protein
MPMTSRTIFAATFSLILASTIAGCSEADKQASFVYSEDTLALIPEAQNGIEDGDGNQLPGLKTLLDERFGDPQQLRAWMKLPIDFGGSVATVARSEDDAAASKRVICPDGSGQRRLS